MKSIMNIIKTKPAINYQQASFILNKMIKINTNTRPKLEAPIIISIYRDSIYQCLIKTEKRSQLVFNEYLLEY